MDMILIDWTRMGKVYCLAGAVAKRSGGWRFVRPLQLRQKNDAMRNTGWSPYLLDGHHVRWEVFELVGVREAPPQPPHVEDLWVLGLRSRQRLATPAERRAVLEAGVRPAGQPAFGEWLTRMRTASYLEPGTGDRSLATIVVPQKQIAFRCVQRNGALDLDYRVSLNVPGLQGCTLPVKDHFLLQRAETAGDDRDTRLRQLDLSVSQMGERIAVRLGLSREYAANRDGSSGRCWLMADGFFSLDDPQP